VYVCFIYAYSEGGFALAGHAERVPTHDTVGTLRHAYGLRKMYISAFLWRAKKG